MHKNEIITLWLHILEFIQNIAQQTQQPPLFATLPLPPRPVMS